MALFAHKRRKSLVQIVTTALTFCGIPRSHAIRMAAFTVFCAGALTIGAEFAAVVFASLGYALALFNFAIALRMSTFLGHDCYLLTRYYSQGGSYRAMGTAGRELPIASILVRNADSRNSDVFFPAQIV